ncbi:MAG: hypothetical protein HYV60_19160, partial [Planctomycetia bacterium]|nr:hypothetical protein [Planctomycetia bacterium]
MLYLLTVPANNARGPRYMEKALAAMHEARVRCPVTLIYGSSDEQVGLFIHCHPVDRDMVLEPIVASYPQATITPVENPSAAATNETWTLAVELRPELYPILRHAQFEDLLNHTFADPVSGLLRSILPDPEINCRIEITLAPAARRRCHQAREAVKLLDRAFFRNHHRLAAYFARHITRPRGWFLAWLLGLCARCTPQPSHTTIDTSTSRLHEREENLQAAADKLGGHLFEASIQLTVTGPRKQRRRHNDRLHRMAGAFGTFTKSRLATFAAGRPRRDRMQAGSAPSFLLSHEELATLWHPPTEAAQPERMQTRDFLELEAQAMLYSEGEDVVVLGKTRFRDDRRLVGIAPEDRRRHLYLVGKTGMGKTTLVQNMLVSDMESGRGLCLIDPHGDLAESVAALVPRHRTNDVILFDAGSREHVIGFNPLACTDESRIDQVTSGTVSAMKKLYDSWGPRLEDTLRNAVFAIVERGGNLLTVMQLLGEKAYREQIVPLIRDPVVRSFWVHEFASWSDNYRTEAVAAIQNKLRPFVVNSTIRAIVTHPNPALDFRRIMDEGKVLIVNLSKGRLGEDNSTLLGALIVTSIQQAAMTRADIPETERKDFSLYVDEFQNFTTGSFASVLSEARKFRLSLIVAHQYLSQLNDETS